MNQTCENCHYGAEDYQDDCLGEPPRLCECWMWDETAELRAQLAEIHEQTELAMQGVCGHSDEVHCTCRPVLLRAIKTLRAELAAARGANLVLDRAAHTANERACTEHERAWKLERVLLRLNCAEPPSKTCAECGCEGNCEGMVIAHKALVESRKGME